VVYLQKLKILFPPAKYDFNDSVSLNAFAQKAATSAVIVRQFNNDLEFFIDCSFKASTSSFSAKLKLNSAFLFFLVTVGERPHKWISLGPRISKIRP